MTVEEAAEDSFGIRYSGLDLNAILKAIWEDGVRAGGDYARTLSEERGVTVGASRVDLGRTTE